VVRRYLREDHKGKVLMEATTSGTIEDQGARMPRRITVSFPGERRRVTIHFSRAALNPPLVSFDFSIPPNAHRTVR
jgi:hypothetical protein